MDFLQIDRFCEDMKGIIKKVSTMCVLCAGTVDAAAECSDTNCPLHEVGPLNITVMRDAIHAAILINSEGSEQ